MVRVQCPNCQRRYRTEISAFGKTAVCTKCSQTFKIGESRPPFQWKATDLAEDSWIGVPPPEEKQEMRHCIICDAPLRPETVRCPECGSNQVTGLVRKARRWHDGDEDSIASVIPVRLMLIALVVAAVGGGVYWAAKSMTRTAVQMGDELADNALAARLAKQLRDGADDRELARRHAGYVKDENLPRFVQMLSAGDPHIRRAAALLVGGTAAIRLEPLLGAAQAASPEASGPALAALRAVGSRRLAELSSHQDPAVRRTAATALCLLNELKPDEPTLAKLSQPQPIADKIRTLNALCRAWPLAAGTFTVVIEETTSPFLVQIEQIGRAFYLKIGAEEFVTPGNDRTFVIPIHQWCAATGSAVDAEAVRELIGGSVKLASPFGAGWEGAVQVVGRRQVTGALPGFLPLEAPDMGRTAEAAIRLQPARR